jgi:hypothetical protein
MITAGVILYAMTNILTRAVNPVYRGGMTISQPDTRTCWAPGDQEHDHNMCIDAVAEREHDNARQSKINALRTMVEYLETHPDMPVPTSVSMFTHVSTREEVDAVARTRRDAEMRPREHTCYTVEIMTIDGVEFQSYVMGPRMGPVK